MTHFSTLASKELKSIPSFIISTKFSYQQQAININQSSSLISISVTLLHDILMRRISLIIACLNWGRISEDASAAPSSPVSPRLCTRVTPSPSQPMLIQTVLSKLRSGVARVGGVRAPLGLRMRKPRNLQTFADNFMAPVHRLPLELLAEVFMHCIQIPKRQIDPLGRQYSFMLPSQVCRYWRGIAFSMPQLWSTIFLDLYKPNYKGSMALAKLCLSRSGDLPLTIILRARIDEIIYTKEMREMIHLSVVILLPHCNRWQDLEICHITWPMVEWIVAAAWKNLPCLQSLSIYPAPGRYWETLSLRETFELAPKLRTLNLGYNITLRHLRLPWGQLTNLVAVGSTDEYHKYLTEMPNLTNLNARLSDRWPSLIPHPVIQLSHLTKLNVFARETRAFFDYFTLPTLRELRCNEIGDRVVSSLAGRTHSPLVSLLSRSSCPLLILTIHRAHDLCANDLTQILELTPELEELHLGSNHGIMTTNVMSRCTFRDSEASCLVPRLRHLDISRDGVFDFDEGGFVDMIESRWRHGSYAAQARNGTENTITRIQTVQLRLNKSFGELNLARCRLLWTEGLDLQLLADRGQPYEPFMPGRDCLG